LKIKLTVLGDKVTTKTPKSQRSTRLKTDFEEGYCESSSIRPKHSIPSFPSSVDLIHSHDWGRRYQGCYFSSLFHFYLPKPYTPDDLNQGAVS